MRVLTVVGNRPQFVKAAAVSYRLRERADEVLVHTGQHYDDWHFNVRPSNTEPLLRLNLESLVSPDDMEAKRDEVLGLIRA